MKRVPFSLKQAIPITGLVLLLAGCSPNVHYQGKKVDPDDLDQIKQGVHNKHDVARILGSPSTMSTFDDRTWYFISKTTEAVAFLNPDVKEQQVIAVVFDDAGLVQEVVERDIEDGKKIQLVERVTETTGQKRSFLQQVFGNFGRIVRKDDPRGPK
ncbi:MAG: outer membrane protein assembly factor BamE [Pseudomonadota bacterium]